MSEPAVFAIVRDGQARFFADRWAAAMIFREIFWGPEALESWLLTGEEAGQFFDDFCGGAVLDFDQKRLTWSGDVGMVELPKVRMLYHRMLDTAWNGFELEYSYKKFVERLKEQGRNFEEEDYEEFDEEHDYLYRTIDEALGIDTDEFDDEDEDAEFDDEDQRTWITLIDEQGTVNHYWLAGLSADLVKGTSSAIEKLKHAPADDIPPELVVTEGMWIDQATREIGIWGPADADKIANDIATGWGEPWTVQHEHVGYTDQCSVSGPMGQPMSDAEALGMVVPHLLSTTRFDLGALFGGLGGKLKKTAVKAAGCLTFLICVPVLIFAAFSGNWTAALITIVVVIVMMTIIFKLIEAKVKSNFTPPDQRSNDESRPAVSGPIETDQRRARMGEILRQSGLPSLAEIEPHFTNETLDELFD